MLCLASLMSAAAALPSVASTQAVIARLAVGGVEQVLQRLLTIMHAVGGDARLASAAAGTVAALLSVSAPQPPSGLLSPPRLVAGLPGSPKAAASLQLPGTPHPRLAELSAAVPDGALQQLRRLLLWQQQPNAGAAPLPAMAEFEGFPAVTGMLDGAAALAAALAHSTAARVLQAGVAQAVLRLLVSATHRGDGAGWCELSPAGLSALLAATQRLLQSEPAALGLALAQPQLVPGLLAAVTQPALEAVSRFVDATSACNPGNSLGTTGSMTVQNDGATAAAALLGGVVGTLCAPFGLLPQSQQHDAALAQYQASLSQQGSLPAVLVSAIAAAQPGGEDLAAAVGLLARLVMASERVMGAFVAAGGIAPTVVEK